jgi:hypothetical protein
MEIVLGDIVHEKNVLYDPIQKRFVNERPSSFDVEVIEEPVIIMETLHFCYSHALLDHCFSIFWAIQDLLEKGYISSKKVRIFVLKNILVKQFPKEYLPIVDYQNHTFKGIFKDIIEIITPYPILFEHLLQKKIIFKESFRYPSHDLWQRSIWNCVEYYPGRNVLRQDIRFPDEKISSMIHAFRNHVFEKYKIEILSQTNDLIIVDRKHNRKINTELLFQLEEEAKKNTRWTYRGVFILEDLSFEEQIKLFINTKFFIMRHGSSLANLIWIQPKSVVLELSGGNNGVHSPPVIQRLCQFVDSRQILFDYNNIKPNDIFTCING